MKKPLHSLITEYDHSDRRFCDGLFVTLIDYRYNKKRTAQNGGTDIEVFRHSISDVRSEVLWRFY